MTTYIKASCHCGLNAFRVAFRTASLPISSDLCHCTSCRHSSGQLVANYVAFDGAPISLATNQPDDLKNLTPYSTSTSATRWFCRACSAHILRQNTDHKTGWFVATGTLERTEGVVSSEYHHIWVADTSDGGMADHIRVIDGLELPRYAADAKGETVSLARQDAEKACVGDDREELRAHCHCNAITFTVTRPSARSALPSRPYPDLLFPYISTSHTETQNPGDEKWWLRPVGSANPTRYLAGHCACSSCRLTSGFEIQSWAFIPRANVIVRSSSGSYAFVDLQDEIRRPTGLRSYKSSPGRNREFCGTCGATVFWWGEEWPDSLDVSVGLFDQGQDGARTETWLEWHKDRVSFAEEAVNRPLVEGLEQGLRESKSQLM